MSTTPQVYVNKDGNFVVNEKLEAKSINTAEILINGNQLNNNWTIFNNYNSLNGNILLGETDTDTDKDFFIESPGQLFIRANNSTTQNNSYVGLNLSAGADQNSSKIIIAGSGSDKYDQISFITKNTEQMRIEANGFVGIGTQKPSYELDVAGKINANEILINGEPLPNASPPLWISNSTESISYNDGSVGIGTSEIPNTYKLAVDGKAIMEEVKVKLSDTWPDYVFSQDYELPSLQELKAYIDKYQHLPAIPSAEEVNENGLELGKMNEKLLLKIEELTLYIINQEEKMKLYNEKLNDLESKLNMLLNK